jgi:hypothetical protein
LPEVLYRCEAWFPTLLKEHRLRAFVNKTLIGISGPKRDNITRGWRKLLNEQLHNLYPSPNKIRMIKSKRMIWAGYAEHIREKRNVYRVLEGNPEGKISLGSPRYRQEDTITIYLKLRGWEGVDWTHLAQDGDQQLAFINKVMNLCIPYNTGNFWVPEQLLVSQELCSMELVGYFEIIQ